MRFIAGARSSFWRRVLRRDIALTVLLGAGLPMPGAGQRLPSSSAFQTWSSPELRYPTEGSALAPRPKRETYKSLGLWVGFGLGVVAVPFAWSACDKGPETCPPSEKTFIAGALTLGGAFVGSLIGRQFKKRGASNTADSARAVCPDSVVSCLQEPGD